MAIKVIKSDLNCDSDVGLEAEINSGSSNGVRLKEDFYKGQLAKFAMTVSQILAFNKKKART